MTSSKEWEFKSEQRKSFDKLSTSIFVSSSSFFPAITFKDMVNDELLKRAISFSAICKILDARASFVIYYISRTLKFLSLLDRPLEKRFLSAGFFIFAIKL